MGNEVRYVVETAIVTCSLGSAPTTLVATTNTEIGNKLRIVETDTSPASFDGNFGICSKLTAQNNGKPTPCAMSNLPKWFVTNADFISGSELPCVTMDSFAVCTIGPGAIIPETDGQVFLDIDTYLMLMYMDEKYPGLREILDDPYGSLYLNKDMYKIALQFLNDMTGERGGSILLTGLNPNINVKDAYILAAIDHLVAACDVREPGAFLAGMENTITRSGVYNGADALYLDSKMMEVLYSDCDWYAGKVAEGKFYKWQEENKLAAAVAADMVTGLAYGAIMYASMQSWQNQNQKPSTNRDIIDAEIGQGNRAVKDLAKTAPTNIPNNATVKVQTKTGYDQISYKWSDGTYKYEARWHTKTPGAPAGQGNTWVVERTTPGTATGQRSATHILTGNGQWTPRYEWQEAITAYQNGTATNAQKSLLENGHWLAP